jgi:small-conductance mechanosensitive channel
LGDQITGRTFTGRVELIDMRTTTFRTDDDQQVIIPNTVIMSEVVVNQTRRIN